MPAFIDRTGARIGRLIVLRRSTGPGRGVRWDCACDCGGDVTVSSTHLGSGHTSSCGCLHRERASVVNLKHGHSTYPNGGRCTKEYNTWSLMKRRCFNELSVDYPGYGGRGVTVCAAWRDSFEVFLSDMGPAPSIKHSIDRVDVNGDYEPGNCRWATHRVQSRNKRTNVQLTSRGVTLTQVEWASGSE